MTLPRPLKAVLTDATDASVIRTWARVQRTRRVGAPRRWVRAWAVGAALAAAGAVLVFASGSFRAAPVENHGSATSVAAILARGRPGSSAPSRQTSQPLHMTQPIAVEPTPAIAVAPVDPVGALLDSANEAMRQNKPQRAAALLNEIAEHHPADARASTALYALGRIQLDSLHQKKEARRSFTRALELNPPEELVVPMWKALQEVTDASEE